MYVSREERNAKYAVALDELNKYKAILEDMIERGISEKKSCEIHNVSVGRFSSRIGNLAGSRGIYELPLEEIISKELSWPDNMMSAAAGEEVFPCEEFDELWDSLKNKFLTNREIEVLEELYIDNLYLYKVADKHGVTTERIRQIAAKALRKLRSKRFWYPLMFGKDYISALKECGASYHPALDDVETFERYDTRKKELISQLEATFMDREAIRIVNERAVEAVEKAEKSDTEKVSESDIDILDLSVRSYNVLKRAGISTIGELMKISKGDMMTFRNMGRKSMQEIVDVMKIRYCFDFPDEPEPKEIKEKHVDRRHYISPDSTDDSKTTYTYGSQVFHTN